MSFSSTEDLRLRSLANLKDKTSDLFEIIRRKIRTKPKVNPLKGYTLGGNVKNRNLTDQKWLRSLNELLGPTSGRAWKLFKLR
ncbi:hypothetical protein NPIL_401091 [Nephila pilipes]|uniref:Uncharacterized protein n=1 Tax=Nephila pilipes TaxID=299642 RepID=A0A8X6Q180_NEPPI|nr:hypothetical protein NPIL_401091 [Nephila pilipes]